MMHKFVLDLTKKYIPKTQGRNSRLHLSEEDDMSFNRLDRTFIKALIKAIGGKAEIVIHTNEYIITGPKGRTVTLDVITCLRRPSEDHKDMIDFVKWKVFLVVAIISLINTGV